MHFNSQISHVLQNTIPRVSRVIRQIKELFKIKYSTIKVCNESGIELSSQDFIHSGRTYIVRRLPPDGCNKRRVNYT